MMITKQRNGFEQIIISDKLEKVVGNAIKRVKEDTERNKIKLNLIERSINY
jgi:hypothetical protein